jgi:threonine aldolase
MVVKLRCKETPNDFSGTSLMQTEIIDLRSDTFSLPSKEIRESIAMAEVGDDYYGEDKSAAHLESYCSELFGKEAALFTTSGMLANQLAVALQVTRGNEVVTEYRYHLNLFESAQYAALCHVVLNPRVTEDGVLRAEDVEKAMASKPREAQYAQVQLVAIENPIGSQQGKIFPLEDLRHLRRFTAERKIHLHMDGARIFNAHVATRIPLRDYAREADTLTVCFSKGLGAPFGSMFLGNREIIQAARRLRMWYGSGFHQIGFCAEAAYFALTHQMDRIAEDHRLAQLLAGLLREEGLPVDRRPVETNMIYLDFSTSGVNPDHFVLRCKKAGLLVLAYPPCYVRLVVCRNVNEQNIRKAAEILVNAHSSCDLQT